MGSVPPAARKHKRLPMPVLAWHQRIGQKSRMSRAEPTMGSSQNLPRVRIEAGRDGLARCCEIPTGCEP
jgi:hypothetical protein